MSIYVVQPGDTMAGIAALFNIPLGDLIKANPQIKNPNVIFPGQTIYIPTGGHPPVKPGHFYVVQRGDTMYSIAARYGLTVEQLERANPQITNPNLIYPGQVIHIP